VSNPNGFVSQKLCHYLNQGRKLDDTFKRAARWVAYFDLSKPNSACLKPMYWKRSNPNCNGNRRDKVALKTTCIKNVKLKIVKIRTDCQYIGYFNYSENLNWAAQNLLLGHMRPNGRGLDIAELDAFTFCKAANTYYVDLMETCLMGHLS